VAAPDTLLFAVSWEHVPARERDWAYVSRKRERKCDRCALMTNPLQDQQGPKEVHGG
jgi:hypothetical protein